MALCTACGTILHEDDANSHICVPADKPVSGTANKVQIIDKPTILKSPNGNQWELNVDNAGVLVVTLKT